MRDTQRAGGATVEEPELQSHRGEVGTRGLTTEEVEEWTSPLVRSFHDQPHFVDMFPDSSTRMRALPHVFTAVLTDAVAHGRVDTARIGGQVAGVAVWYPPGRYPLSPRRQLRALPSSLRIAFAAPRSLPRVMRFQAEAARLHPEQPYFYLAAVGVDPGHQGLGLGTELLRRGLDLADSWAAATYLETHTDRNVGWYASHGFDVRAAKVAFTPGGPPNWTMLRPAASR